MTHSANPRDGKRRGDDFAPLTSDDFARFHKNAPAALARRGPDFVAAELGRILGLALAGLIPIAGLLYFGWSASEMLLFLLVGSWIGIVCDTVKFFMLPTQVQRFGDAYYDDWHVWVVANAIRRGDDVAPKSHLQAKYQPELGVFIDFILGGIATAIICVALAESGFNFRTGLWENFGLWKWLALFGAYEVVLTLWEIARHTLHRKTAGQVKVAVGMRGLGLFLLLFVVVMIREAIGDNGALARGVMLAVNGAILAAAVFNSLGLYWLRTETNWLHTYLRDKPSP